MKSILTSTLLAVAVAASAQDITFKNAEGLFKNTATLSEVESINHSMDENGQPIVNVSLKNGAIYSSPAEQVQFTNGEAEDILKTERFANMIKVKEYEHISDLKFGDFAGVFHEEDYSVDEFIQKSYSLISKLSSSFMDILSTETKVKLNLLALTNGTTADNIRIHVSDIIYVGEDGESKKVPLSARLIYPYCVTKNTLSLNRMYIENHVTIFQKDSEPTSIFSPYSPSGVCANGYLVVQPDLLGWGTTRQYTQIYIDKDLNGSAIAYSAVAAKQYVEWSSSRDTYGVRFAPRASIINVGSSQGASSALSGTYYIENKLDKSQYSIPELSETRLCAGAYNMHLCMDKFCETDDMVYACKMPMLVAGAFATHGADFAPYTIHDYFNPLMKTYSYSSKDATTGAETLCGTPWQILDLKIQSSLAVEASLYKAFPSDKTPRTPSLKKMMSEELIKTDGDHNYLDWENPKLAVLNKFLESNNFASKDVWTPKARIQMVHAKNDDIIPYATAEEFYNNQNYSTGSLSLINFTTLDEVPEIKFAGVSSSYAVHMVTCFEWILSEVTGIPISMINDQLKDMIANQPKAE